jgi:DNA-directed RNA polymerase specialized sigma24 family protein
VPTSGINQITLNHCRAKRRSRLSDFSLDNTVSNQAGDQGKVAVGIPVAQQNTDSVEALDIVRKALAGLTEEHRTAIRKTG